MINNNDCKNCTPVLPLVFDESLSYYETLCKIYEILNYVFETKEDNADTINDILNRIHTLEKTKVSKSDLTLTRLELENKINEEISNLAHTISESYVNIIDYQRDKQTAKEYINTVVSTATANMNKEAFFIWGGKDLENNLSPIDASMLNVTQANRFSLMSSDNILWENSNDGGNTWNVHNVTNQQKIDNVTTYSPIKVTPSTNTSILNQMRVTFTFPTAYLYMRLLKLAIDFATTGAKECKCKIETSSYNKPDIYSTLKTVNISGDNGWNIIQTNITIGRQTENSGGNYINKLRLTFSCNNLTNGRPNNFSVRSIFGIAPTLYRYANNLQKYGVPYVPHYTGRIDFEYPIKTPSIDSIITRAIADESGNNIENTYMKKTDTPSNGVISLLKTTMTGPDLTLDTVKYANGVYEPISILAKPQGDISENINPTIVCIMPGEGKSYENTKSAIENGLKAKKELIKYDVGGGKIEYFLDIYSPNPFTGLLKFDVYYTV